MICWPASWARLRRLKSSKAAGRRSVSAVSVWQSLFVNDYGLLGEIEESDRAVEVKELILDVWARQSGFSGMLTETCSFVLVDQSWNRPQSDTVLLWAKSLRRTIHWVSIISTIVYEGREVSGSHESEAVLGSAFATRCCTEMGCLVEIFESCSCHSIQRYVIPAGFTNDVTELHHFCGGSQVGFGACSYIILVGPGNIQVALVTGKYHLAPLKQVSIPGLELLAAVILLSWILYCTGNSMFTWLVPCSGLTARPLDPTKRYKVFVANRISLIRMSLLNGFMLTWRKILLMWRQEDVLQTTCHPADLAVLRSCDCSRVNGMSVWFDGSWWWPRCVFLSNVVSMVLYGICCPKFSSHAVVVWC